MDYSGAAAAAPVLDMLMLASKLAVEHQAGLTRLVGQLVGAGGGGTSHDPAMVLGSLRALCGALAEVLQGAAQVSFATLVNTTMFASEIGFRQQL